MAPISSVIEGFFFWLNFSSGEELIRVNIIITPVCFIGRMGEKYYVEVSACTRREDGYNYTQNFKNQFDMKHTDRKSVV